MYNSQKQTSPYAEEANLFQVKSLDQMKALDSIERSLTAFRRYIRVSQEAYETFYKPVFDEFIALVQYLPDVSEKRTESLVATGLRRALKAAKYCHDRLQDGEYCELETYVLVTAMLMKRLGGMVSNLVIQVCKPDGSYLCRFNPLSMDWEEHLGACYKVRYRVEPPNDFKERITPILAQRLLPKVAVMWLSDHPETYAEWIALLMDDMRGAGSLANHLNQIEEVELAITDELADFIIPQDVFDFNQQNSMGEEYWKWLKKQLEDGKLSINEEDSLIHRVEDGWFMDEDLFKQFSKQMRSEFDPVLLAGQYNAMGISRLSGGDYRAQKFFASERDSTRAKKAATTSMFNKAHQTKAHHQKVTAHKEAKQAKQMKGVVVRDQGLLKVKAKDKQHSPHIKSKLPVSLMNQAIVHALGQQEGHSNTVTPNPNPDIAT